MSHLNSRDFLRKYYPDSIKNSICSSREKSWLQILFAMYFWRHREIQLLWRTNEKKNLSDCLFFLCLIHILWFFGRHFLWSTIDNCRLLLLVFVSRFESNVHCWNSNLERTLKFSLSISGTEFSLWSFINKKSSLTSTYCNKWQFKPSSHFQFLTRSKKSHVWIERVFITREHWTCHSIYENSQDRRLFSFFCFHKRFFTYGNQP